MQKSPWVEQKHILFSALRRLSTGNSENNYCKLVHAVNRLLKQCNNFWSFPLRELQLRALNQARFFLSSALGIYVYCPFRAMAMHHTLAQSEELITLWEVPILVAPSSIEQRLTKNTSSPHSLGLGKRSRHLPGKKKTHLCNTSSMRRSVTSPDETLRRGLKIQRAAEYFWPTSRCFIWWWNTVPNAWYYLSNNMIFEGEIKDAKTSSFSSDFHTLIKHNFPLYFCHELIWVWESKIPNKALENFTHEWYVLQNCALPTWHLHGALILFWETRVEKRRA